ncbi:MAG: peptide-methionine (S)-S-oxide reductase MsrA [Candidatus Bathyarchaeia archaeon]
MSENSGFEVATLAGGCFWCVEAAFSIIRGVIKVEPGYTGGDLTNPSYEDVTSGVTGHVEAVQVTFDPEMISFCEILEIFFSAHDPTTVDRQGPDVGSQYRSAIFYSDQAQKKTAEELIAELNNEGIFDKPIITSVEPLKIFYNAEVFHKDYYKTHLKEPYCQVVIAPKIAKLQQVFFDKLKVPS